MARSLCLVVSIVCLAAAPSSRASADPGPPAAARAEPPRATLAMFEAALAQHGAWIVVPSLGRVWRPAPRAVGPAFVPYATRGHWTFTEDGWIFESSYPWGWATFHYGRWARDLSHGWVWIPGVVWAPAWVIWRSGDGYVGWVPSAPSTFRVVAAHWTFVEERHFLDSQVSARAVAPTLVANVYARTLASTAYVMRSGVRWSKGPSPDAIARATHTVVRPAPRRAFVPPRIRRPAEQARGD